MSEEEKKDGYIFLPLAIIRELLGEYIALIVGVVYFLSVVGGGYWSYAQLELWGLIGFLILAALIIKPVYRAIKYMNS